MKQLNFIQLTSLSLSLCLPVTPAFASFWDGVYYGGMIGLSGTNAESKKTYGNDNGSPLQGWNSNHQFQGNVYNSISTMKLTGGLGPENPNVLTLIDWISGTTKTQKIGASGSLLAGISTKSDQIIMGGEVKLTFGNFGITTHTALENSSTKSGSDFEGGSFTFTNYQSVISGVTSPTNAGFQYSTYSVNYQQTSSQKNAITFHAMTSLVGRLGYSFGDFVIYGMTGPAYTAVKMSTLTTIHETATGTLDASGDISDFTAEQNYSFANARTKYLLGYTVGSGIEWDIRNGFMMRVEAEYNNLGSATITGIAPETFATYDVKQTVTSSRLSTGIIKKF